MVLMQLETSYPNLADIMALLFSVSWPFLPLILPASQTSGKSLLLPAFGSSPLSSGMGQRI